MLKRILNAVSPPLIWNIARKANRFIRASKGTNVWKVDLKNIVVEKDSDVKRVHTNYCGIDFNEIEYLCNELEALNNSSNGRKCVQKPIA